MVSPILERELHEQLKHLPLAQQRQVLDFARALVTTRSHGVHGSKLLHFAGTIEPDDIKAISKAVEVCETVNSNDW